MTISMDNRWLPFWDSVGQTATMIVVSLCPAHIDVGRWNAYSHRGD